jgi:type 1 fimbria pilin
LFGVLGIICLAVFLLAVFFNSIIGLVFIMNKSMYLALVVMALSAGKGFADVEPPSTGKVEFKGTILKAACKTELDKPVVDFGSIGEATLVNGGKSEKVNFSFAVSGCGKASTYVSAKFTGMSSAVNADWYALTGNASEAGIVVTTKAGASMSPGKTSPKHVVNDKGVAEMGLVAWVEGKSGTKEAPSKIVAGAFKNIVTWQMNYK